MATHTEKKQTVSLNLFLATAVSALVIIALLGTLLAVSISSKLTDSGQDNAALVGGDDNSEADYSVLTELTSQDVVDFFAQKKSGFIYVGRPTCPHCQAFAPVLTSVVKVNNLTVYYYNTDANNSNEKHDDALTLLNITGVPTFLYVKDGVIAGELGDRSEDDLLKFFATYEPR